MRIKVSLLLIFLLYSAIPGSGSYSRATPPKAQSKTITKKTDERIQVEDNAKFALGLYQELRESKGNLFFSPYSISTALAMTYAGARGNTESQMAATLRFSLAQQRLHPAFKDITSRIENIQDSGDIKLRVANSLWPQQGYKLQDAYVSLVKKQYGVSITSMDYKHALDAARQRINDWVEEKTEKKIQDIIPPGALNDLTRLVLVNAIYFNGYWESQFEAGKTEEALFFLSPIETIRTPLMSQKQEFWYADMGSFQALEIPYAGNNVSMLILLPRNADGLEELENNFTVDKLNTLKRELRATEVQLFLPKFGMTSMFDLRTSLQSMGMVDPFSSVKADFSGIDGREHGLFISAILHKAFVEVQEAGTEAAAASANVMQMLDAYSLPVSLPIFRADHPFLFLIQVNTTGNILFMGRVNHPSSSGE